MSSLEKLAVQLALEVAAAFNLLDPSLLKALAWIESAWNPRAKSERGALGLCQLMPATAFELGVADSYCPMQNALGAAAYLRRLQHHYHGDERLALCAYNWGLGHVDAHADAIPESVLRYARSVLERRDVFAGTPMLIPALALKEPIA